MLTTMVSQYRGELAALSAALIWAIASVVYTGVGRQLSPLMLNLVKGGMAIVLLIVTLLLTGTLFPQVPGSAVTLLLLSGAIGVGFGDTAYFAALNRIGPRRTLVLEALAPPMAAILALVFLQEQLPLFAWLGIGLTVSGVTWVVLERSPQAVTPLVQPLRGVSYGILAAIAQATGAVLSRAALAGTDIDPLWSTLVRLIAAVVVLLVWLTCKQWSWQQVQGLRSSRLVAIVAGTAFASTYLGIWLQQFALKYSPTGIAQALTSTSPLFVIPFAMIGLGEKVSLRAVAGVVVAIAGVWLLFARS